MIHDSASQLRGFYWGCPRRKTEVCHAVVISSWHGLRQLTFDDQRCHLLHLPFPLDFPMTPTKNAPTVEQFADMLSHCQHAAVATNGGIRQLTPRCPAAFLVALIKELHMQVHLEVPIWTATGIHRSVPPKRVC